MSNGTTSSKVAVAPKRATDASLFWTALFLPINLVFHPLWFASESIRPSLDSTPIVVTLVKLGFFLSVCYGFYMLAKIWPGLPSTSSNAAAVGYRLAGLATLGGLIAVHGPGIYHYAAPERELHREVRAISKSAPVWVAQGVRLERARLEKHEVFYEYTMTNLNSALLDSGKFRDGMLAAVSKIVCANEKLMLALSRGVRLHYVYRDSRSQPLADFALEHQTCVSTPG